MMELLIRPISTQFYRDGLPFDAGQDTESTTLFPPYPRTFYGALRAQGFAMAPNSLAGPLDKYDQHLGSTTAFGEMRIKGPLLTLLGEGMDRDGEMYLPFPADVPCHKKSEELVQLVPSSAAMSTQKNCGWDLTIPGLRPLVRADSSARVDAEPLEEMPLSSFLPSGWLGMYLTGGLAGQEAREFKSEQVRSIVREEYRIGIARDNATRTAREGMLYRARHFRLEDRLHRQRAGFWLLLQNAPQSFPKNGIIRLGGESRPAAYVTLDAAVSRPPWYSFSRDAVVGRIVRSGRFKAFLITPALFEQGAVPDCCMNSASGVHLDFKSPHPGGVTFKLVGAAISKEQPVGGWDIKGKQPKELRPAVPAGSVYFFEAEDKKWQGLNQSSKKKAAEKVYDKYNFETLCAKGPWNQERGPGKEGFGIALIGGW